MQSFWISQREFKEWKINQLKKGGDSESLDFLISLKYSGSNYLSLFTSISNEIHKKNFEEIENTWNSFVKSSQPIQYLVGKCFWRDLEIQLNNDVLIPRPETELIIDIAREKIINFGIGPGYFADLGTGSGAIAIAFAKEFPAWKCIATDISPSAIDISKRNSCKNLIYQNLTFYLGDWWEPIQSLEGEFNLILSNPPYIPERAYFDLDPSVLSHEPCIALYGGKDGLNSFRIILKKAIKFLKKGGWLIVENHFDQDHQVGKLFIENGFEFVKSIYDFNGIKRFVEGRKPL
tara:strand:- start:812 stop:1684 length:873 start_codon:yes stop_codon:yes gene_type:complete